MKKSAIRCLLYNLMQMVLYLNVKREWKIASLHCFAKWNFR
jgi:hypothetical protein